MIDLSSDTNWLKIYDQVHVAQPILNYPNKYIPIQNVTVSTILTTYTIAISSSPTNSKPTWDLGAKCYQIINIDSIGEAKIAKVYYVEINQVCIINVTNLGIPYKLCVEVPEWFKEVHLQIWAFKGEILNSLEESLKLVQDTLAKIEDKLDTLLIKLELSSVPISFFTSFDNSNSSAFLGII